MNWWQQDKRRSLRMFSLEELKWALWTDDLAERAAVQRELTQRLAQASGREEADK